MKLVVPEDAAFDGLSTSPELVRDLREAAQRCDGRFPFLLLPVRIETRFGRGEVPGPVVLTAFADRLDALTAALGSLAGRNYATTLPVGGPARSAFKRAVEDPLTAAADQDLDRVEAELAAARGLIRDVAGGPTNDAVRAQAAAGRGGAALASASRALARTRSPFHRDRLLARLAALEPELLKLFDRAGPLADAAAEVFAAFDAEAARDRRADRTDRPSGPVADVPVYRVTDSGLAFRELLHELDDLAAPGTVTRARRLCTRIAVLPAEWRERLLARLDAAPALPGGEVAELREAVEALPTPAAGAAASARDRAKGLRIQRPGTRTVDLLKVRIFPDDVAVETHERELTAAEQESGATFWAAAHAAGGDEPARRAAWRALCAKHGTRRAAWLVRSTRPAVTPPPDDGLAAALRALRTLGRRADEATVAPDRRRATLLRSLDDAVAAVEALGPLPEAAAQRVRDAVTGITARLPLDADGLPARLDAAVAVLGTRPVRRPAVPAATRDSTWTRPARAGLMPERFAVITVSAGQVSHVAVGEVVPRDLVLGLDPGEQPPADGELPTSLRWMVDYGQARAVGLAVTVQITREEAAAGFDRVYVLGLGPDETPDSVADRLGVTLDGHHYGPGGLAVLADGTPTNGTDRVPSGYRSQDDPDAAFDVEFGPGLISAAADPAGTDGAALARALGIGVPVLDHVAGVGGRDLAQARTVAAALWPGTFGFGLEELLGALIGTGVRDRLRALAVRHVLGRGALPAIRIGTQPYGVLLGTAFDRWKPGDAFERTLLDVLGTMREDWTRMRESGAVPHTHSTGVTDPQQHVLEVLGLDASAVGFEQRFAVNVARRAAVPRGAGLGVGLPRGDAPPDPGGAFALLSRFRGPLERAGLGAGALVEGGAAGGAVAAGWADTYERLRTSRPYEVRLLRAGVPIATGGAPPDAAARITALLAQPVTALVAAAAAREPEPLLLLLLRQALLVQARDTALRMAEQDGWLDEELRAELGSSFLFRSVSWRGDETMVSRWGALLQDSRSFLELAQIGRPGTPWTTFRSYLGQRPMAEYLDLRGDNPLARGYPGAAGHADLFAVARDHATAVAALGLVPPARLDTLLAEHLDVCSHRLDAWLLALPARRLETLRDDHPVGLHVGAFGWVEDLRPAPPPDPAAAVPPVLDDDPTTPVRADRAAGTGGFVHAPSINHAVTAAVLRAGYVAAQATGGAGARSARRTAVNLGSRRTRSALDVLEGVRAGNEIGALLGYQFERDLHDGPPTAEGGILDAFVQRLRRTFPTAVPVAEDADPDHARAARAVVDGLALLCRVQAAVPRGDGTLLADLMADDHAAYPYGLVDGAGPQLPARTDGPALAAFLAAVDRMADTVDALGDLVLTEGVHQLVQGNHVRAAATLAALAAGKAPPRPEVVDTPVPGRRVTHRLMLQLDPVDSRAAADPRPIGWETVPLTPRAAAEPSLNRRLGLLLGPSGGTRIRVLCADGTPYREVTLTGLGLQPVDLLALVHDGFEQGLPELAARAVDAVRPLDVRDGEPGPELVVDLEPGPDWPGDIRCLPETVALLESLAAVLTAGRAADAGDYLLADTAPSSTTGPVTTTAAASGVDLEELAARADAAVATLEATARRLLGLLSDGAADPATAGTEDPELAVARWAATYRGRPAGPTRFDVWWSRREDAREACLAAGAFGLTGVTPPTRWPGRTEAALMLLESAEAAFVGAANRLREARRVAAADPSRETLLAVLRAVFGESLPVLPLFRPRNAAELDAALAADLVAGDPVVAVDRWLHAAAAVREPARELATAIAVAEAFGAPPPRGRPVQLPLVNDDTWLGGELPAGAPGGDRLSLVVLGDADLDPAGPCAAVLVDTWTELIPEDTVTTGLAFRYDTPDAAPPQCLLLAVPPVVRPGWSLADLVATVHDTLELAKDRAVEPQHLQGEVYGQLLPAVFGELPPRANDPGPVPYWVTLDFAAASAAGPA